MQLSLKTVVATAALALASTSALALESTTTGDSSLFASIWDPVRGVSVIYDLGMNYSQFMESTVTPDSGLVLTFDVGSVASLFAASSADNVRYQIFAGDGQGALNLQQALITGPLNASISVDGGNVNTIMTAAASFIAVVNQNCGPAAVTCVANTSDEGHYAGDTSWGDHFGNVSVLPDGSGALGSALAFYALTPTSRTAGNPASVVQYANANGVAQWLLGSDFSLTFTAPAAVPLPAAVWLLLSGLGGLGVISRRRPA